MRPIYNEIIAQYDIYIRKYQYIRSDYYLDTNKGKLLLRKVDFPKEQIQFEYEVDKHLFLNRFEDFNKIFTTKKKTPYVAYQDHLYVMQEYKESEETDFKDIEDLRNIILVLAKFHKSAKHVLAGAVNVSDVKIKNTYDYYKKRIVQNKKLKKIITNSRHKSEFELMYIQDSGVYEELEERALDQADQDLCQRLINDVKKDRKVAHKEYTYHAVDKTKDNRYIINNLDACSYDIQMIDLAYILGRIMQKNNWDIQVLYELVNVYNDINPITEDELKYLKMLLIFPSKYDNICLRYCSSKRRWNYNMFEQKWQNMLAYQKEQIEAACQIEKW